MSAKPQSDRQRVLTALAALFVLALVGRRIQAQNTIDAHAIRLRLTITSPLAYQNTPLDPVVDFSEWIGNAKRLGVVDPNTIEVFDAESKKAIPHALSEDFAYRDQGRVAFVVADPRRKVFEIRFRTASLRPQLKPSQQTPQIGVGDLLRYNAGKLRPIAVPYSPGLHDLDGDGLLDLTGTWNYAYRPGWPWDGVICYPRITSEFAFGDLTRLRYVPSAEDSPKFFSHTYMAVDFADFNRDGRLDIVTTSRGTGSAAFYLNLGKRDPSGMPRFEPAGSVKISGWQACRAVDLDRDGSIDLVVDGQFLRNENSAGWPFRPTKPAKLDAGRKPCFLDVDGDGKLDSVCLQGGKSVQPDFYRAAWRRNLGGDPPSFGKEEILDEVQLADVSLAAPWFHQDRQGLIVQHGAFQELSVLELESAAGAKRSRFRRVGRAESLSAVMSLSDQAWPCLCDWNDDGVPDLLIGGGYGWPRIVMNRGTATRPAFDEPKRIIANDKTIRLTRNELLGEPHNWHDMGYSYPVFVDWNGDGLRDLVCPNETNRIYWFANIGSRKEPRFGPRRQVLCEGYPDSPALRSQSNRRANDPQSNNGVYPLEKGRPFFWRTGAAFADFNGDGLVDLVTHDGETRKATLFVQYRDAESTLRLRKDRTLRLTDGRPITDAIVDRRAHWTESFRAVDWNGDGLQDLIYSVAGAHSGTKDGGSIYLLRNMGEETEPRFAPPETMRCFGKPIRITNHGPHPWAGDFDRDGKPDLVACVEWSVYPYYSHAALMMKQRPKYVIELMK